MTLRANLAVPGRPAGAMEGLRWSDRAGAASDAPTGNRATTRVAVQPAALGHAGNSVSGQGCSASFLSLPLLRTQRVRLTFVVFDGGHRIGARQPAVQIDVGAAARTKRTKTLDLRLAADGAGFRLAEGTHAVNLRFA